MGEKSVLYVYMHVSVGMSVLHTITCIHTKCMLQPLNCMPTELEFVPHVNVCMICK